MASSTWYVVVVAAAAAVYYSGHWSCLMKSVSYVVHGGKSGCLPVGDVGNVKLHYFDVRGRAEAIRMLMEYANISYSEVNFDSKSWPAQKEKGMKAGVYTFGQVPAVETSGGVTLVQSQVITHYLGRAAGLDCDCDVYHWCDTLAATTEDIRSKLGKILYDPNFSLQQRSEYLETTLPQWLQYLEKLAPERLPRAKGIPLPTNIPAFVGDRITWVDFLIFDLLDTNVNFGHHTYEDPTHAPSVTVLHKFPRLSTFYTEFSQLPALTRYFTSRRRRPFQPPNKPVEMRNIKH